MDFKWQAEVFGSLKKEVYRGMKIVSCLRFDEASSTWNTDRHSHKYLEILYFIKGEALVEGEHSHSSVSANHLIVYPPDFIHKEHIDFSKSQEVYCLSLSIDSVFPYQDALTAYDVNQKLEWIMNEIYQQKKSGDLLIAKELLELLFSYLKKNSELGITASRALAPRVKEYIRSHYQTCISQAELCDLVHVSPSYLSRTFKKETGLTPVEFLNKTRIEQASLLLRKKHLTVEAVGAAVGIPDQKYFSKVFKKITGSPPREFRNSQF